MPDTITTIRKEVQTESVADPVLIHKPLIAQEDLDSVMDALASTFVSGDGPACRQFEKELQEFLGTINYVRPHAGPEYCGSVKALA